LVTAENTVGDMPSTIGNIEILKMLAVAHNFDFGGYKLGDMSVICPFTESNYGSTMFYDKYERIYQEFAKMEGNDLSNKQLDVIDPYQKCVESLVQLTGAVNNSGFIRKRTREVLSNIQIGTLTDNAKTQTNAWKLKNLIDLYNTVT
jgi:hypothetical protein